MAGASQHSAKRFAKTLTGFIVIVRPYKDNERGITIIRQNFLGDVMNRTLLTLVALLLSGTALSAQIVSFPTFAPAVTTGAVGLASTQTAQLNVVSLTTSTTAPPTAICQVQLEFWDAQGKLVISLLVPSLAPGATASLQIKLSDVTTKTSSLRTEIRGVVRRTTPVPATGGTVTPTPIAQPIAFIPSSCAVATTLEIFDSTTGVTQALTSDLHALEDFTIIPLPATNR